MRGYLAILAIFGTVFSIFYAGMHIGAAEERRINRLSRVVVLPPRQQVAKITSKVANDFIIESGIAFAITDRLREDRPSQEPRLDILTDEAEFWVEYSDQNRNGTAAIRKHWISIRYWTIGREEQSMRTLHELRFEIQDPASDNSDNTLITSEQYQHLLKFIHAWESQYD